MAVLAKSLILLGVAIAAFGLLLWFGASMPWFNRLGRLPGDIYVHRGNVTFYFPLVTSIVISVVASLIFALLRR